MKMKKTKDKFDKWFLLDWKNFLTIVVLWFVFVFIHNAIYGLFGVEDAIFFILAVLLIPLYFLISIIYSIIKLVKKAQNTK